MGRGDQLGDKAMSRLDVLHMIKRRAEAAGIPYSACCHTFRAMGITTYLQNGGTLEHAQIIANHESPRTTKLYDRTREELTFEESRG
jgi:integrase/recombinase XerD